jgi:hypothetical protein
LLREITESVKYWEDEDGVLRMLKRRLQDILHKENIHSRG